jgi:hypothetical protein
MAFKIKDMTMWSVYICLRTGKVVAFEGTVMNFRFNKA